VWKKVDTNQDFISRQHVLLSVALLSVNRPGRCQGNRESA
jgi:hypothetical protein